MFINVVKKYRLQIKLDHYTKFGLEDRLHLKISCSQEMQQKKRKVQIRKMNDNIILYLILIQKLVLLVIFYNSNLNSYILIICLFFKMMENLLL